MGNRGGGACLTGAQSESAGGGQRERRELGWRVVGWGFICLRRGIPHGLMPFHNLCSFRRATHPLGGFPGRGLSKHRVFRNRLKSCPDTRQGLELPQIHARTKRPEISVLILCSTLRQEHGYGLNARNFRIGGHSAGTGTQSDAAILRW